MAPTVTAPKLQVEPQVPAETAPAATAGTPAASASAGIRPKNAYKLTDPRGRHAYLWWEERGSVVEADDPTFRRRVRRALKKPFLSVEDETDEFGVRWSTHVLIQPDDPRYPSRLYWSWIQIGLHDVEVQVVRRSDRQPVQFSWASDD